MLKVTTMAIGLEHAIEGLARKAISSFTGMTASYEKLYFLSNKLGQSAASIKSFQFAAEANGASAAEATALVEKLIDYRRKYGAGSGNDVIGSWFKIDPNSTTKIKDITESLSKMSQQQASAIGRARRADFSQESHEHVCSHNHATASRWRKTWR